MSTRRVGLESFRRLSVAVLAILFFLSGAACSDEAPSGSAGDSGTNTDIRARDIVGDTQADGEEGDVASDTPGDIATADTAEDGVPNDDSSGDDVAPDSGDALEEPDDGGLCTGSSLAHTGTNVQDTDADPIRVDDLMTVTIEVFAEVPVSIASVLRISTTNLAIVPETISRDGSPIDTAEITAGLIDIPLTEIVPAVFTFDARVVSDTELIVVLTHLDLVEEPCTISRSHSGAVLQVLGGQYKIPNCMDMRQIRTLQVAPNIQLQETADYRTNNGERDDLTADNFIYCPQHPAIVHVAEFCLGSATGQRVSLAGHYRANADWEADDFVLIESLDGATILDDGFTTQTNPGHSNFWCEATQANPCPSLCQATLTVVDGGREIEPLAVVSSVGDSPRRFDDEVVDITPILPDDGSFKIIRVTFLDVGIEGLLDPQLYLVSEDPD